MIHWYFLSVLFVCGAHVTSSASVDFAQLFPQTPWSLFVRKSLRMCSYIISAPTQSQTCDTELLDDMIIGNLDTLQRMLAGLHQRAFVPRLEDKEYVVGMLEKAYTQYCKRTAVANQQYQRITQLFESVVVLLNEL